MSVEQLLTLLGEYPGHWQVEVATHRDSAEVVELLARQDATGGDVDPTPVVVIST